MRKFKEYITYEKSIQWIFRFIILSVVLGLIISLNVLPIESDEYFELADKSSTEAADNENDILYKGSFQRLFEDGTTEDIIAPGKIDIKAGEVLTLQSIIPKDYSEDYIIIRSSQQDMRIYVDGELRVDYNTEKSRPVGSQTTSRFVFCKTSEKDAGKVLLIETKSDSGNYSGTVNKAYACDRYTFWKIYSERNGSDTMYGFIMICIGALIVIISMCMKAGIKFDLGMENLGWCIFLIGTWLMGESRLRQLLFGNVSAISNVCFLAVMIAAIPFLMYLNELQSGRYKKVYKTLINALLANYVILNIMQLADIADYLDTLMISHFMLGISLVTVIVLFVLEAKKHYLKEYAGMCVGMVILICSVLLEVISAYYKTMLSGTILLIGVLLFLICAVFDTIYRIKRREKRIQEEQLLEQKQRSDNMTMQMIKTLSETLELKDEYTRGHSFRVAEYSVMIARRLGMDEEELAKLHYAVSLHDIGKIGVPDTILNKPSKLSNDEYEIIKKHATIGADILKNVELIAYTETVARYHHERYDGRGYPEGLYGEQIPLEARIVAVADTYDAMNSRRIYRDRLPKEEIRKEINRNKGIQFDPKIADIFLELFDSGELDKVTADDNTDRKKTDSVGMEGVQHAEQMLRMVMETMQSRSEGENIDFLTGLWLRNKGEQLIREEMLRSKGALVFLDMDNLKTINDIYGHKTGDNTLHSLGEIIREGAGDNVACRIGGDEFLVYFRDYDEHQVAGAVSSIINRFNDKQNENNNTAKASLSAGICMVDSDSKYEDEFNKADKALYFVKQNGKNGYYFYRDDEGGSRTGNNRVDLKQLVNSIKNAGSYSGALNIEYREFAKIYEYIEKVCMRYEHDCHLVLVTLDVKRGENVYIEQIEQAMDSMGIAIRENIRNVDVCTRYSSVQYLVIFLEAGESNIDTIMQRVFSRFYKISGVNGCIPEYQGCSMKEV